jgi:hypothetical protein
MQTWLAAPAIALVLVGTVRAQQPARPAPPPPGSSWLFGPSPASRTADTAEQVDVVSELLKDITLTPQQAAGIDSLRERYIVQYQVFTPGVRPDPATRQHVRDLVRRQLAEARAILTVEQQPVWDRNVADVLAMLASGMPELFPTIAKADVPTPILGGPSALLASLLQNVALTPAQRLQVDSIRARYGSQAPIVPLGTEPDSATIRRIRELSRQTLDGIRTVLTLQQQQVWDRNLTQALMSSMPVGP